MAINKNESVANKRCVNLFVYESDGITPAPTTTQFQAIAAFINLSSVDTGVLTTAVLSWGTKGAAGNSVTIQLVADGAGSGSVTQVGSAYKFHFAAGVTTINNMNTALQAVGFAALGGTFTGTNTLGSPGDVFGPSALSGGQDSTVFVRPSGGAWATALGTLTNTGVPGNFEYQLTQAETNVDASELEVRIGTGDASNHFTVGAILFNSVINTVDMRDGTFNSLGEGSNTYGDMLRLIVGVLAGTVADFRTGTLVFKSLDTTKNRLTVTTDSSGRLTTTPGDLSGP